MTVKSAVTANGQAEPIEQTNDDLKEEQEGEEGEAGMERDQAEAMDGRPEPRDTDASIGRVAKEHDHPEAQSNSGDTMLPDAVRY